MNEKNLEKDSITALMNAPFMKWVHMVLYTLGFAGITICLNEYANGPLAEKAPVAYSIAIIIFLVLLWVMQGVKLINWQSLVVSCLFAAYAFFFIKSVSVETWGAFNHQMVILMVIEQWLLMMLLCDLLVSKKIRDNKGLVAWNFALLCVAGVFLLLNRNGRIMPATFLLFVLMSFLTVKKKEWELVTDSILLAGIIGFAVTTVFIFVGSPFSKDGGLFFENNGGTGQFYGFNAALALVAMIRWGKKYERISAPYFTACIWLLASLILSFVKGGHSGIIGMVLCGTVFAIVYPKGKDKKKLLVRAGVIVGFLLLLLVILLIVSHNMFFRIFFAPYANDLEMRQLVFHQMLENAAWGGASIDNLPNDWEFLRFLHNHYVYLVYEYGYLAGGIGILFVLATWGSSVMNYIRRRSDEYLLPVILGAMTIGIWANNLSGLYYPMTFFCILSMYPVWTRFESIKNHSKES